MHAIYLSQNSIIVGVSVCFIFHQQNLLEHLLDNEKKKNVTERRKSRKMATQFFAHKCSNEQ